MKVQKIYLRGVPHSSEGLTGAGDSTYLAVGRRSKFLDNHWQEASALCHIDLHKAV